MPFRRSQKKDGQRMANNIKAMGNQGILFSSGYLPTLLVSTILNNFYE